jgi:hypothetical protein
MVHAPQMQRHKKQQECMVHHNLKKGAHLTGDMPCTIRIQGTVQVVHSKPIKCSAGTT